MRKILFSIFMLMLLMFSCAGLPPEQPPVTPAPVIPTRIMGTGRVSRENMAGFLSETNPAVSREQAALMARLYIEEARIEGINADVAFSQMCLETGFLRFGGLVTPDMNNFCGLGSTGPGQAGEKFPSPQIGVRAHIQHLKGYASTDPLNSELVDPRYRWVKYGTAPTVHDLAGRWAADKEYGNKISGILQRLYDYSF